MDELSLPVAVGLLIVAAAVAVAVKYVRLPYTIALVIVGAGIGLFGGLPGVRLSKELLLTVLLPPLLFEGALYMDLAHLRENARSVGSLAFLGTLIASAAMAAGAHYALGWPWPLALLLGVMLAPTDPASVLALFKSLRLERLSTVIEGESVFNDGLAVVLYGLVLESVLGKSPTPVLIAGEFLYVVAVGALVGIAFGYLAYKLLAQIDDHLIEVVLTVALAYGVYLLAEAAGASGVIAVVLAGLIMGNYGRDLAMSPTTRVHLTSFWEFGAFIANSLLFLLIGLGLSPAERGGLNLLAPIALAVVLMLLARALGVYLSAALVAFTRERLPLRWQHALVWGGLKGSIPVALVLGVHGHGVYPPEQERQLLAVVFAAVFFSLVVQGLTVKPLLRRLGLLHDEGLSLEDERWLGRERALEAALAKLDALRAAGRLSQATHRRLSREYQARLEEAQAQLEARAPQSPRLRSAEEAHARRRARHAERAALHEALERGLISERAYRALLREVDARHWGEDGDGDGEGEEGEEEEGEGEGP